MAGEILVKVKRLPKDIVRHLLANYCHLTVGRLSVLFGNMLAESWPTGYRQPKMGAIVQYYQDINQAITCTKVSVVLLNVSFSTRSTCNHKKMFVNIPMES